MFISFTLEVGEHRKDIRLDSEQKISEPLKVLRINGIFPNGAEPDYYRSLMNGRPVSAHMSFKEEGIFDGDVLTAILPDMP